MATSREVSGTKKVIFKADGSLDKKISNLLERLKIFWTPGLSDYVVKPTEVRNMQNPTQMLIVKRDSNLATLFVRF